MKQTKSKLQDILSSSSTTKTTTRRVVVTGLGLVTPLGSGVSCTWKRLLQGDHGFVSTESLGFNGPSGAILRSLPSKIVAPVPRNLKDPYAFNSANVLDRATKSSSSPDFIAFAIAAAGEALYDAGLLITSKNEKETTKTVDNVDGTLQIIGKKMNFDEKNGILANRFGVAIGSGIGNVEEIGAIAAGLGLSKFGSINQNIVENDSIIPLNTEEEIYGAAIRKVSPYFVPRVLINMAGAHVSMRFGLKGPSHAASTACTSGAHSIGDAFRLIKHGYADAMVAGGTESCIGPIALTGFSRAKALSLSTSPSQASRPFDTSRDGFVLGEGAGVIVLEEFEQAKRRGAKIYAEIKGYGLSSDAHHITSPPDDGSGALQSMRAALFEANISALEIDYVNAHATSTPTGDAVELRALSQLFLDFHLDEQSKKSSSSSSSTTSSLDDCKSSVALLPLSDPRRILASKLFLEKRKELKREKVAISSTKGSIGHLLGAAGAVEAIFSILSLTRQKKDGLPPTRNLTVIDKSAPIDVCSFPSSSNTIPSSLTTEISTVLTNSFGFGGINTSLLFSLVRI